jgi:hypothetical protein
VDKVTVGPVRRSSSGGDKIAAAINVGQASYDLWFRVSEGPITAGAEPILAQALFPAMRLGVPLHCAEPVSARLLGALPQIQEILHCFDRGLSAVPVVAPTLAPGPVGGSRGVGAFFSAGVDSFYTLLKHIDEIDTLVFIHGFDLPLDAQGARQNVSRAVHAVAAELGKSLIEVETNLRLLTDVYGDWMVTHGTALASVALCLSPRLRQIYVPASDAYDALFPRGSHPLLDPLWSTETIEVVHDGCELTRIEKVARIAGSETVRRWLRVCWEYQHEEYNCGVCSKCLRTMVELRATGALDKFRTFTRPLDLTEVAKMALEDPWIRDFAVQDLRELEEHGNDPQLAEALKAALSRGLAADNAAAYPAIRGEVEGLRREVANLRLLVGGYEQGRVMRLLLAFGRARQRLLAGNRHA